MMTMRMITLSKPYISQKVLLSNIYTNLSDATHCRWSIWLIPLKFKPIANSSFRTQNIFRFHYKTSQLMLFVETMMSVELSGGGGTNILRAKLRGFNCYSGRHVQLLLKCKRLSRGKNK